MVRRVVARRVLPGRPPSWEDLVTHAQWEVLRPAFRADRRLQAECRIVLSRLPTSVRSAFVSELASQVRRSRRPPQALGLAVELAARRALARHGVRVLPVLVPTRRRRRR